MFIVYRLNQEEKSNQTERPLTQSLLCELATSSSPWLLPEAGPRQFSRLPSDDSVSPC